MVYRLGEFILIERFVKPGDVCLDVGANMGFYSIWFSKFANSGCSRILSFEPDKKNFERLQQNIELNRLDAIVKPYQVAVSDREGEVDFTTGLDGENHIDLQNKSSNAVKVKRLDALLQEEKIDRVKYAKIDVEGFEMFVLKGMGDYFRNYKIDVIQLEINQTLQYSGLSIDELLQFFKDSRYELAYFDIAANELRPFPYSPQKDSYFLVHNLDEINQKLALAC